MSTCISSSLQRVAELEADFAANMHLALRLVHLVRTVMIQKKIANASRCEHLGLLPASRRRGIPITTRQGGPQDLYPNTTD